MRNVSEIFKKILNDENHVIENKVNVNDEDYFEDVLISIETNTNTMKENIPSVGNCVSSEIDMKMIEPTDANIPRMAAVMPFVRACVIGEYNCIAGIAIAGDIVGYIHNCIAGIAKAGETVVGKHDAGLYSEWLQKGKYYIDTRTITHDLEDENILTIHGYDQMLMLEQMFPSSTMEFPAVDTDVLQEIADFIGFEIDPRTFAIMNKHYQIPLPAGYSCREVVSYIAASYCCNAIFNEIGELRLVPLKGGG